MQCGRYHYLILWLSKQLLVKLVATALQCQKMPALKLCLGTDIFVENDILSIEAATVGVGSAPIGIEIRADTCNWRQNIILLTDFVGESPLAPRRFSILEGILHACWW